MKPEPNAADAIWLRRKTYRVMPLNPRLVGHVLEVESAIDRGISALRDVRRSDFYVIELQTGLAYIHIRENAKTVYVVAYSSFASPRYASVNGFAVHASGVATDCLRLERLA